MTTRHDRPGCGTLVAELRERRQAIEILRRLGWTDREIRAVAGPLGQLDQAGRPRPGEFGLPERGWPRPG